MRFRAVIVAFLALAGPLPAAAARPDVVRALIAHHAAAHRLPLGLADAVVRLESRYNPVARNGPNLGLTQISFATAKSLGYRGSAAGLLDAETNLRFGMRYLAEAHRLAKGDVCGTIMRYQSGLGATRMSATNRVYCGKVKALMARG